MDNITAQERERKKKKTNPSSFEKSPFSLNAKTNKTKKKPCRKSSLELYLIILLVEIQL